MNNFLVYEGPVVAKPRLTRKDKWAKPMRSCVARYWAFKDLITLAAKKQGFVLGECFYALFEIEMPKSWSEKKKKEMTGTPMRSRPDLDNCIKALGDSLLAEDSCIWKFTAEKHWATKSRILIQNMDAKLQ